MMYFDVLGDELPSLAQPRRKYEFVKIDLNYLDTMGASLSMPGAQGNRVG